MGAGKRGRGGGTREQVLEAALRKFSEKSFLGATTAEIAALAGISEKTIFDLFGDKKSLYMEVRETVADTIFWDMVPNLPLGAGAPSVLRALGREFLRQTYANRERVRVSIQAISAIEDKDIKKNAQDFLRRIQKFVAKTLAEGQGAGLVRADLDVEQFAWAYTIALHSLGYIELMEVVKPPEDARAMFLVDRLVDMVEAEGGALARL